MKTGWPYGPGTSDTGDRPEDQLAAHAAPQSHPPFEAPAAPVKALPTRARGFPREQASTDQRRPAPSWGEPAASKSCWMCGIRLSADQMVADGGSACLDLRWYCRDTWACTERWTSRPARVTALRQAMAEKRKARRKQATDTNVAQPVPV
jgi:hypothetical protein